MRYAFVSSNVAAGALAFALAATPAIAASSGVPDTPMPAPTTSAPKEPATQTTKSKTKKQRRSEQEFYDGYRAAHALVQAGRYADAIAALHALDHDEHPDVANYIGYASRKLGDYEAAKVWYEKALAADPKHARTWQYYGMWHVEQGNLLKAADHLQRIKLICGEDCKEYRDLKGGIEGTVVY